MWGHGVYFSTRADYSANYSVIIPSNNDPTYDGSTYDGHNVFLCCKVAVGKAYHCYPDDSLRRPPSLPSPNENSCYDSVSGITEDTKVYVLY
jgi:hypothetical protein